MSITNKLNDLELSYSQHEMGSDSYIYMVNESDISGYSAVIRETTDNEYTVSISTKLIPSASSEGEALHQIHDKLRDIGTVMVPEDRYSSIGDYIDYTLIVDCTTEDNAIEALNTLVSTFTEEIGDVSEFDYIWTNLDEEANEYQVHLNYDELNDLSL